MSPETHAVLTRALELTDSYGLAKKNFAWTADDRPADICGQAAVCFCTIGFLQRAGHETKQNYYQALTLVAADLAMPVPDWNVRPETSLADVKALFKKALS